MRSSAPPVPTHGSTGYVAPLAPSAVGYPASLAPTPMGYAAITSTPSAPTRLSYTFSICFYTNGLSCNFDRYIRSDRQPCFHNSYTNNDKLSCISSNFTSFTQHTKSPAAMSNPSTPATMQMPIGYTAAPAPVPTPMIILTPLAAPLASVAYPALPMPPFSQMGYSAPSVSTSILTSAPQPGSVGYAPSPATMPAAVSNSVPLAPIAPAAMGYPASAVPIPALVRYPAFPSMPVSATLPPPSPTSSPIPVTTPRPYPINVSSVY